MYLPNLHTIPNGHLIKIRTFLDKNDYYYDKHKFAWHFEGLKLKQMS